jgi:hypothetical protein
MMDTEALADHLREAEEHHGQYEPTAPKHRWSDWYAAYIHAREQGSSAEAASNAAVRYVEGGRS